MGSPSQIPVGSRHYGRMAYLYLSAFGAYRKNGNLWTYQLGANSYSIGVSEILTCPLSLRLAAPFDSTSTRVRVSIAVRLLRPMNQPAMSRGTGELLECRRGWIIQRPLNSGSTPVEHDRIQEGYPMFVIDCDYLPADKVAFPPELALLIVRKAAAMAEAFKNQALDQLTKDAKRALAQGAEPQRAIRETRL